MVKESIFGTISGYQRQQLTKWSHPKQILKISPCCLPSLTIWDNKWLPTLTTHKVISPQTDFEDFLMVSSLIDNDTKWWKVEVVRSIFLPFEASTILKISLSYNFPEDSLIWISNKRGTLIVKSAYYIASSMVVSNEDWENSSINLRTSLWKRIWHQKIPSKLKIFAWKTCVSTAFLPCIV